MQAQSCFTDFGIGKPEPSSSKTTFSNDEGLHDHHKRGRLLQSALNSKVDLSGADLSFVALTYARLAGSNLSRTYLNGANFTGTDLSD
jgi:uncharacterized protein YjbI with pentapeptide repeats